MMRLICGRAAISSARGVELEESGADLPVKPMESLALPVTSCHVLCPAHCVRLHLHGLIGRSDLETGQSSRPVTVDASDPALGILKG